MRKSIIAIVLLAMPVAASAQMMLTTTLSGGNGQNGAMFDITNISNMNVVITGFDQGFFTAGTAALYEIYTVTSGGSFVGNENNPAAWTLQGMTTNVAHPTVLVAVPIPIPLNISICPGQTLGFYCTTSADTIAYTNGTAVGNVYAMDANIQFLEGVGKSYPFGSTFTPRVWNGIIRYSLAPPTTSFEQNDAGSSLTFNGVQGSNCAKAIASVCTNSTVTVSSGGTTGQIWEAAYNFAPIVPAGSPGSITTPGGQVINVDFSAGVSFLNGGTVPSLLPYFGPFTLSFNSGGAPGTISFQQLVGDPSNPEGFSLSQATELQIQPYTPPAFPIAGPTGDDSSISFNVGCISLFGQSFSQINVISNGRVMFGGSNTAFTPVVSTFAIDAPSFGVWTDLNPSAGGTINVTSPAAGIIDVAWNGVPYYGTTSANSFNLQIDTNTGFLSIIGLTGLTTGAGQQLIGLSGGSAVGATDPGPVDFSPGGMGTTGVTSNGTDMIYRIGTQGTVVSGINRIDFFPNGVGNFDWISQ